MRIAVTGAMGFIGTEVVSQALAAGLEVIAVDFYDQLIVSYEELKRPILDSVYQNLAGCVAVVSPWEFIGSLKELSPQVVVHAGAAVNTMDLGSHTLFERNVRYVRELCHAADEAGAHIVFTSSASVYGAPGRRHPLNPYALTKAMGEKMLAATKVRTVALRLFNVFGRFEHHKGAMASVPFKLAEAYRTGDRIELHSPEARRDFVPVTAVARAILDQVNAILGPRPPMMMNHWTFDVGTGDPTSFADLDEFVRQAMNKPTPVTRWVQMPAHLEGRYQGFTRAGGSGTINVGSADTRTALGDIYGT